MILLDETYEIVLIFKDLSSIYNIKTFLIEALCTITANSNLSKKEQTIYH